MVTDMRYLNKRGPSPKEKYELGVKPTSVSITDKLDVMIGDIVRAGWFASRSEFFRYAATRAILEFEEYKEKLENKKVMP